MRKGMAPREAGLDVPKRIAHFHKDDVNLYEAVAIDWPPAPKVS